MIPPARAVRLTRTAGRQLDALLEHVLARHRIEAAERLQGALRHAVAQIAADPVAGRPHPANYPEAARWGYRWIKVHRYWFAYAMQAGGAVITNVLFETADILGRVADDDAGVLDAP